jgi:hypothetical protein
MVATDLPVDRRAVDFNMRDMQLSRSAFVEHFAIVIAAQCLKRWPKRQRLAPTWMSGCFYQWMRISAGEIDASAERFAELIDPVLEELHQTTPRGQTPEREIVAGMIYDRLAAAGVEVRIRPRDTAV